MPQDVILEKSIRYTAMSNNHISYAIIPYSFWKLLMAGRFNYDERISRLSELLIENSIDILLLLKPSNILYFTGFGGGGVLLVSSDGSAELRVHPIYRERAENEASSSVQVVATSPKRDPMQEVFEVLEGRRATVGYDFLSAEGYRDIVSKSPNLLLTPASELVWRLRQIKGEEEIELLRKACEIAAVTLEFVKEFLTVGTTTREIKAAIAEEVFRLGADSLAFGPIIKNGSRTAFPDYTAIDEVVRGDELVIVDLGVAVGGYLSDLCRTFYVGGSPPSNVQHVYEAVLKARQRGVESATSWTSSLAVDENMRLTLREAGFEDSSSNVQGHGIGLEHHEPPLISPYSRDLIPEGAVITLEPAIYLPGKFGVKIEDMYIVRREGLKPIVELSDEITS